MEYSVIYDSTSQFIHIRLCGELTSMTVAARVAAILAEATLLVKQHNCYNVLVDLRESVPNPDVSTLDIFALPKKTEEILSASGLEVRYFKRALLVTQKFGNVFFFETISLNRGHSVKLFCDLEEAKQWLANP